MKTQITVALSMFTGVAVGAVGVHGLQAQSKPKVYLINEIDVTDPDKYGAEFAPKAQATVRTSGAQFLVIGGVGGVSAKPIHGIEGTAPKRMTIQVWDSVDAINNGTTALSTRTP